MKNILRSITGKHIAVSALVLILLGGLLWQLIPRSFSDVVAADVAGVSHLTCSVSIAGFDPTGHTSYIDYYSLPALAADDRRFAEIITLLNSATFDALADYIRENGEAEPQGWRG